MRAVVCRELSGLDGLALEDIPLPEPGPGEVRIRVRAAGLNFADTPDASRASIRTSRRCRSCRAWRSPARSSAAATGVAGFTPGERVMATPDHGGFAEAVGDRARQRRPPAGFDRRRRPPPASRSPTAPPMARWAGPAGCSPARPCVVHGAARRRRPRHGRVRPRARRPGDRHRARCGAPRGGAGARRRRR